MSMALDHPISAETILDDLMRTYTATIPIFIRHKMLCIGCPIGDFHTVPEACEAHTIDEETISRELVAAMRGDTSADETTVFAAAGE